MRYEFTVVWVWRSGVVECCVNGVVRVSLRVDKTYYRLRDTSFFHKNECY